MIEAVIFDLDGVIVSTDNQHYLAWKRLAEELGIYFDREINMRQRGVSRMESLEVLLEGSGREYGDDRKAELAERKNGYYKQLIGSIEPSDILPGVSDALGELKRLNIKTAIGSSSKNAAKILKSVGLDNSFDFVADGNMITCSKPFPDVFLAAANGLGVNAENCLVVEDADAGVEAAHRAGMAVLAVGSAAKNRQAEFTASGLDTANLRDIFLRFTGGVAK